MSLVWGPPTPATRIGDQGNHHLPENDGGQSGSYTGALKRKRYACYNRYSQRTCDDQQPPGLGEELWHKFCRL